ncbi:MAG: hypothetical protein D6693_05840 [Planctomycetota bacterium]|nr:MAG: hypothetical protein D6693_05840 [Planctomycetota bacterium]
MVLIAAALAKAKRPALVQLSLGHALGRAGLLDTGVRTYPLVVLLIALEILLGVWLISGWRPRRARRIAAGTLLAFTGYLVAMSFDPAAPPCACTGGIVLAQHAQASNFFGVGRNLVLLASLILAAPFETGSLTPRSAGSPPPERV